MVVVPGRLTMFFLAPRAAVLRRASYRKILADIRLTAQAQHELECVAWPGPVRALR